MWEEMVVSHPGPGELTKRAEWIDRESALLRMAFKKLDFSSCPLLSTA